MKKLPVCLALLFSTLIPFISCAQTQGTGIAAVQQKLSAAVTAQFTNYPREKAFVQTNQNVYLSGETIWYKAYATAYGKPSQLSKVIYVRLSDAHGKLIKQDKLPLVNSTAHGNIDLPDSLRSGWYTLQVFTAWMLNFSRDNIFGQTIYIQKAGEPVDRAGLSAARSTSYHINFFAEGGKPIDGVISNIAFKAVDGNGQPVNVYGEVLDNQQKEIIKIKSEHDGMGSFNLETYANADYKVRVHFPDRSVQNIPLPKVEAAGLSFRVNPAPVGEIDLMVSFAGQQQAVQPILVEAVQEDGTATAYPLQLSRGLNVFALKTKDFSNGILHLGAFDERGNLVAERSVFIDDGNAPKISVTADGVAYKAGSENTINISVADQAGFPLKGNFSVAVTDADMGTAAADNIGAYFLFQSEESNYVHDPGYYFTNSSDSLRHQLDLLMLTGSAGHFNWAEILNPKKQPLRYAAERSQFIAGKIENYQPSQNLKLKMMIASADSGKVIAYVAPDSTGIFKLDNYSSPGNADIFYEAVNAKNRKENVAVTFFNENLDTVHTLPPAMQNTTAPDAGINTAFVDSVALGPDGMAMAMARGITLKAVDVKQVKTTQLEKLIESHVKQFDSDNAQTLDVVDAGSVSNQSVLDYIVGRFPGLNLMRQEGGGFTWMYHGSNALSGSTAVAGGSASSSKTAAPAPSTPASNNAYFYIDEVRVDESTVDHLPMTDVALVRFIPPPVWFAPLNGGFIGAIMVYTKTRDDARNADKILGIHTDVLDQYTFNGYSVSREFSPRSDAGKGQKPGADFRTTLFWSHDLQTDARGNVQLHFFANGETKHYRIVVQGFDKDGRPVYLDKVF